MLFNKDGLIKNYTTPEEVVAEFYALRLHFYELRRQAQLKVSACLQTAHGWPWRVSARHHLCGALVLIAVHICPDIIVSSTGIISAHSPLIAAHLCSDFCAALWRLPVAGSRGRAAAH